MPDPYARPTSADPRATCGDPHGADRRIERQVGLTVLRMDEILHHFETMRNHYASIYRRIIRNQGFLGGAKWILSIHCRSRSPQQLVPKLSPPFLVGRGSPSKMNYRKQVGTLILTSLLADLVSILCRRLPFLLKTIFIIVPLLVLKGIYLHKKRKSNVCLFLGT